MTACAIETAPEGGAVRRPGCTIAADGSYAARLAGSAEAWFPERWTLDGPEPYAVPLPADQPEEPGTEVLPLADGRVLIHRRAMGRHLFSLLYPTGPTTGELPLGAVEFGEGPLTLLPPAPGGGAAYALAVGAHSTALWLVAGGAFGPEHVAEVPGRCTGGVWLDREGRILALDREGEGGAVKSVAVDLERGGEVTPLLQITERSNDRLLLADPDSGLLMIRSDAPGEDRLGWGVLGSTRPVRFPESLRVDGCTVTPFAAQPGQVLTPESCAVAVRIDRAGRPADPSACWVGLWRPTDGRLHQLAAPQGWLSGSGLWTRDGVLRLPFATPEVPCGVAEVCVPPAGPAPDPAAGAAPASGIRADGPGTEEREASAGEGPAGRTSGGEGSAAWRPVPLQQATLTGRLHRIGTRPPRPEPETAEPADRPRGATPAHGTPLEPAAGQDPAPGRTPVPGPNTSPGRGTAPTPARDTDPGHGPAPAPAPASTAPAAPAQQVPQIPQVPQVPGDAMHAPNRQAPRDAVHPPAPQAPREVMHPSAPQPPAAPPAPPVPVPVPSARPAVPASAPPTLLAPPPPASAHAAATEMVRMTVPVRIEVPVPTVLTGRTTPLTET